MFVFSSIATFFTIVFVTESFVLTRFLLAMSIGPIVILFNRFGWVILSRLFFAVLTPYILFIHPIINNQIIAGNFFWFPVGMLFLTHLPIIIFDLKKERYIVYPYILLAACGSLFIDEWMRYGLFEPTDLSWIDENYYFYKVPLTLLWGFISYLLYSQVVITRKYAEERNLALANIEDKNLLLSQQSKDINTQLMELKEVQKMMNEEKIQMNWLNERLTANEAVLKKAYLKLNENSKEIESQNQKIVEQNNELLKRQIEITKLNTSLEAVIEKRTKQLAAQNESLTEYAYFNSHKVRAPLARIMGILNLIELFDYTLNDELSDLLKKLDDSAQELDQVIRQINRIFEKEEPK